MVLPLNNFKSSVNGKHHSILTDTNLNCQSSNIVYLITCNVCKFQYVGETQRSFGVRMREHLNQIRKREQNIQSNQEGGSQLIYKHFCNDELHRNIPLEKRIRFQIIEKIKTDDLSSDPKAITKRRTERELYWISKLRTAHPLGLNDMIAGFGIRGKATDAGFSDYNHLRIANLCDQKSTRRHRNRHRKKNHKGPSDTQLNTFSQEILTSQPHKVETLIFSKSRKFLKKFISSTYFNHLNTKLRYLLSTRLDFIRKVKPVKKELVPVDWSINFSHKIIDDINIESILNNPTLVKTLPSDLKNKLKIRKIFKFESPVSQKILNYNKILKSTGNLSHSDILSMTCECASSPFRNDHFGHIISGDLNIIQEPGLRKICSFGTKFRDVPRLNPSKIKNQFCNNLKTLIGKISRKYKIPTSALKNWRKTMLSYFNDRLQFYAKNIIFNAPTLSKKVSQDELKKLQQKFVITVVDKASGNYAFTCKKLYFLKLAEELGLNNAIAGNDTYRFCPQDEATICQKLKTDLLRFRVSPPNNQEKLALLYQTPKFHKNPPKMRYIAGNVSTITSQLDERVAKILKMCKSHFRNLCRVYENYSGIRYCFDVETSTEVKDMFDSAYGKVNSISINDFSTLYTLFDHDHLLNNIRWLLDTLSKNSGKYCIKVEYEKARWVSNANDANAYTISETLDMISFLVKETYIKAFGHIFQQVKGIIMGGKISGWLSDCSLMVDEFKFIKSKISNGLRNEAEKLKYFRRYRDDCTTLNCENFLDIAREIYPPSLSLTQENDDSSKANVLDMEVNIQNLSCNTKIYCKTDHFPFDVISFPYLESNIDKSLCYRVYYGQIIRFQRLCSDRSDFELRTRHLGLILKDRGYELKRLEREFCKAISKYVREFQKWAIPDNLNSWFKNILNDQTRITLPQPVSMSFSQPPAGSIIQGNIQIHLSQP